MYLLKRLQQCRESQPRRGTRRSPVRRRRRLGLFLEPLECRLALSDGTAATTALVKDINPGTDGSDLQNLADLNGTLLFSAFDPTHGQELWKSDGTSGGTALVRDINPSGGSYPVSLENVNGTMFFTASDGTLAGGGIDRELWKSDGTEAGTVLVKDVAINTYGLNPERLTNVNGTLFFTANDGVNGRELWKSDGSAAGTVLVKDITPGTSDYGPTSLANLNGTLFFSADDGVNGRELWKSDGTAAGTVLVKDINNGSTGSNPDNLTSVNGLLFFSADDGKNGRELWESDGTAKGTKMVKDIYSGSTNFTYHGYYGHSHTHQTNSSNPSNFLNANGTLFFVANDGTHGRELWKSDGTSKGTVLVADTQPGSGSSSPSYLTNVSGTVFFGANDGTHGWELWKSDGTAAGTVLVQDINPGSSSPYYDGSLPSDLVNAGGTVFFRANDGTHGRELWQSDGTAAGTVLVKDINPGTANGDPESLTVSGGHLFFSANDGATGQELWDPPISPGIGTPAAQTPVRTSSRDGGLLLGPVPARAADIRLTEIVDVVLTEAVPLLTIPRFGSDAHRLWRPLRDDLSVSLQIG